LAAAGARGRTLERHTDASQARTQRQLARLHEARAQRQARRTTLEQELADRQTARAALDTTAQCRERNLEKDQIMLDLQVLLASLHD